MSIAATGITDLLTAQDQPVDRAGRGSGEAFSSILGGFSAGPAHFVGLPTMAVGNPTPAAGITPDGLKTLTPAQAEGETDFVFDLALSNMSGGSGEPVERPVALPEASTSQATASEVVGSEIGVFETGDLAPAADELVPAVAPSQPDTAGKKAQRAISATDQLVATSDHPDIVETNPGDIAEAALATFAKGKEGHDNADDATPDAGQPGQDQQGLVTGQTPPIVQIPVVTVAPAMPTGSKISGTARSAQSVSEAESSATNGPETALPALNALGTVPSAPDISRAVPAAPHSSTVVLSAPILPDVLPEIPPATDKAKAGAGVGTSAQPAFMETAQPVLEDMAMPVQELADKMSAVTHGRGGDGSKSDNQESTGQILPDAAGRTAAAGQMQAVQHSLAQQLAGMTPAGVPFGHAVRDAVQSAHQSMVEDLMIGNSVEDQWVDRLAQDVQALVSSDNREARLHLRPRELGDLSIRLEMQDGKARVHFTVDTAAAQALIADAAPRLQAMMENRGFRLEQSSVDVGSSGANAGQQGGGGNGRQDNQPFTKVPPSALADVARRVARQTGFERYA